MDLQVALDQFLLQLQADGRSPHTIGQYRRHGRALAAWLDARGVRRVTDLTPDLLARFFADDAARTSCRGGAKRATSLNALRTSIRCWCTHLHDAGLVGANPARLLRRARCSPPPPKALREDEQKRLFEVLAAAKGAQAERDRMLAELLFATGIRIGSALALDCTDVDFAHGELTLRRAKNDRPAVALLPRIVGKRLRTFLGSRTDGPVFRAGDRRLSMRHAQRRLATWLSAAGITGKSAHSLRHSFATRVYAETGDLQLTQQALGHASVTSTVIYATLDRQRLRQVVGA